MKKILAAFLCAFMVISISACSSTSSNSNYRDNYSRENNSNLDNALLTAKVKAKLHETDNLDSSDITVKSSNGNTVELTGTVPSKEEIRTAGDAAHDVDGVKRVQNELTVK